MTFKDEIWRAMMRIQDVLSEDLIECMLSDEGREQLEVAMDVLRGLWEIENGVLND